MVYLGSCKWYGLPKKHFQLDRLIVRADFWSVKFYPYTEPGVDPVFAVCGGKRVSSSTESREMAGIDMEQIFVARPPTGKESKMEIIQLIRDEEVGDLHAPSKARLMSFLGRSRPLCLCME
jgi:hypothetical protein